MSHHNDRDGTVNAADLLGFAERCDTLTRNATPGPWTTEPGFVSVDGEEYEVVNVCTRSLDVASVWEGGKGACAVDDAALVAAAPEIAATAATIARQLAALLDRLAVDRPPMTTSADRLRLAQMLATLDHGHEAAITFRHAEMLRRVLAAVEFAAAVAQPVTPDPQGQQP